jgi:hypothetical protein
MDTVETSTPTETPAAPPVETPSLASESIADHAAQFGATPEPQKTEADDKRTRHRAASQRARAEDVPRIAELTKNWRTEQDRVKQLEAELAKFKTTPPPPAPSRATSETTFEEKEPVLEDFADQPDPYTAWTRALGRYDRRREAFEAKQAEESSRNEREQTERAVARDAAYHARLAEYVKTKPDFGEKFNAVLADVQEIPNLLERAIKDDDNGPAVLYHLLTHASDFDDMRLLTDGKPVTEQSVALLRRRLNTLVSRSQAAATGSAVATASPSLAPRPPNPVRTGPLKTGEDPPGDGHSISDHEKYWGPKARR